MRCANISKIIMFISKACRLSNHVCPRYFHTGSAFFNIPMKKQSRIMNKLMNVKGKSKRKWYEPPKDTLPTIKHISKTSQETGKIGAKRVAVLNKLFMKNITDLICTGSLSREVLGRGLEISKVDITSDFRIVRVYWVSGGGSQDADTEALLQRTAGVLRHELSQLRLMGEVPTIIFVKDEQAALIVELDRRLAHADYGEDYEPKSLGHILKSEFTLNTKLSPEIIAKIQQLEMECVDEGEESIPEMTHTVYGLDHFKYTNRIRAARKSNEDAWGRLGTAPAAQPDNLVSYRASDNTNTTYNFDEERKDLSDFLQKRQIQQDKLHKMLHSKDAERRVVYKIQEDREDEYYEEDFDEDDSFYAVEELENSSIPDPK